jgi:hypothetical protein
MRQGRKELGKGGLSERAIERWRRGLCRLRRGDGSGGRDSGVITPLDFSNGATFMIFGSTKNYDLVAVLAMIASIALPQSLLNW